MADGGLAVESGEGVAGGAVVAPGLNGAHDVGGLMSLGAIPFKGDEPVFQEDWEGRVLAMCLSGVVSGTFSVDAHKTAVEGMSPVALMNTSYFEQWLYGLEACLVDSGALTRSELEERVAAVADAPDAGLPDASNEELTGGLRGLLEHGVPPTAAREGPRFAPGDTVATKVVRVEPGREHTSIPGYAQGRRGVVEMVHRPEPLGDAVVAGLGVKPEHLCSVRFLARDLWPDGGARDTVVVDLFESYLEPAPGPAADGPASRPLRAEREGVQ